MLLSSFEAENYRNIEKACLTFSPGVNLLWGENAQGKTNLLEGIYTFARGRSFRGASDADQVKFGTAGFALTLAYRDTARDNTLAYRYIGGERRRYHNGAAVPLSEMMGRFRAVLFYPGHLNLVKGGPGERRLFLNIAISQLNRLYLAAVSRYEKLLSERNAVLKMAARGGYLDYDLLAAYSDGMARAAATISVEREKYVAHLEREAAPLLSDLSGGREEMKLSYRGDVCGVGDIEEAYRRYVRVFSEQIEREAAAGCTLFGPGRDDVEIEINGKSARLFASQGQQRSIVLAAKMAEGEVAYRAGGEYPVFLFDDVLSELDEGRRKWLLSGAGPRQIILTSCERGTLGGIAAHEIYVEGGSYDLTHR